MDPERKTTLANTLGPRHIPFHADWMYNYLRMQQTPEYATDGGENPAGDGLPGAYGDKSPYSGRIMAKQRGWLRPARISWSTPSVNEGRPNTPGSLALIAIFLLVLLVGEAVVGAYCYTRLEAGFEIQECYPEIDASAAAGVSAVNRITGLNLRGVAVFTNPSFVPLYIPAIKHDIAVEGKSCGNIVETRPEAVAPASSGSQAVSLQITSRELPELAFYPLANGGTIHITIVSRLPLGDYALTRTTQVETSVSKPLSSYVR